jgi:hypothetical protein
MLKKYWFATYLDFYIYKGRKAFNFQKMEPQNFLCHAWVSEERVVVGTDTGKLLLFENGEIKNEFNIGASFQDK